MSGSILVTGASGFLGRALTKALAETGCRVHGWSIEDGDIAGARFPFSGVRRVFHLAARTYVPDSWSDPLPFYRTNVLGTVNVLEFCRREKSALTLVSSYVYGRPRRLPIGEDHPLEAFNPYAQTKILAEEAARFYTAHFGVPLTVFRPFNLYGPGQEGRFLIPQLVAQALDPECPELRVADRRPRRDYLYVDDLVRLLMLSLESGDGGTYNAGSGVSVSVEELAGVVNRVTGRGKPLVSEQRERPNEVLEVVADISRAQSDLGWRPRVTLEEGLAEIVRELAAQGPQ